MKELFKHLKIESCRMKKKKLHQNKFSRREFLTAACAGGAAAFGILSTNKLYKKYKLRADTFIAKASSYSADFSALIQNGFRELGILPSEIKGKTVLVKPNLVETRPGMPHINTHPSIIAGAADAFLSLGAAEIIIAEGPGHCRDSRRLVLESGLIDVLREKRIHFTDINFDDVFFTHNHTKLSKLKDLALPLAIRKADWVVSLANMKTHHWAGVTLSMKNMFGIMPGSFYGCPAVSTDGQKTFFTGPVSHRALLTLMLLSNPISPLLTESPVCRVTAPLWETRSIRGSS